MQKLNEVREKVNVTNKAFEMARKKAHKAKINFERVKKERHNKFVQCFDHVANEIDGIYKVRLSSINDFFLFSALNSYYLFFYSRWL